MTGEVFFTRPVRLCFLPHGHLHLWLMHRALGALCTISGKGGSCLAFRQETSGFGL